MENKGSILIIDQDSDLAAILGGYLSALGYRVQFTTRVRESLRKVGNQKFTHIFVDPDLAPDNATQLFMELTSGSGMNAQTPLTLMTANSETTIQMTQVKRLHSILVKPFNLQEFGYQISSAEKKRTQGKAA